MSILLVVFDVFVVDLTFLPGVSLRFSFLLEFYFVLASTSVKLLSQVVTLHIL